MILRDKFKVEIPCLVRFDRAIIRHPAKIDIALLSIRCR